MELEEKGQVLRSASSINRGRPEEKEEEEEEGQEALMLSTNVACNALSQQ